jgi:hypothetical protein
MDFNCTEQAEDIAAQIEISLTIGPSNFKKLRRKLNGDGTIEYRVASRDLPIIISHRALRELTSMMCESVQDNLERPFFVIFDERTKFAERVIVGTPGDEGYCAHDNGLCGIAHEICCATSARSYPGCVFKPSRGHTHPVFYGEAQGGYGLIGCSTLSNRSYKTRYFGALPSNIFGDLDTWIKRKNLPDCGDLRREAIDKEIIKPKRYKRFCEDYIESYLSSHVDGFNGPGIPGTASKYHWIICPRLNQIGVFEVPKDELGVVIYHHWRIEDSIDA